MTNVECRFARSLIADGDRDMNGSILARAPWQKLGLTAAAAAAFAWFWVNGPLDQFRIHPHYGPCVFTINRIEFLVPKE